MNNPTNRDQDEREGKSENNKRNYDQKPKWQISLRITPNEAVCRICLDILDRLEEAELNNDRSSEGKASRIRASCEAEYEQHMRLVHHMIR